MIGATLYAEIREAENRGRRRGHERAKKRSS
jgi:hypothetical protein